jgi:nicotinic acid mononucleotide adenylyltransferase
MAVRSGMTNLPHMTNERQRPEMTNFACNRMNLALAKFVVEDVEETKISARYTFAKMTGLSSTMNSANITSTVKHTIDTVSFMLLAKRRNYERLYRKEWTRKNTPIVLWRK